MASPQTENGFTRIANELMEVIPLYKFNGTQFRILFVVLRYTYGFQRKSHKLSLTFIADSTGMHKQQIKRELDILIKNKVLIEEEPPSFNKPRIIQFNKNYKEWLISRQSAKTLTVNKKDYHTVSELAYSTVSELAYQERNNKENIKESTSSTKDPALEFMNEIGKYYTSLTGRFPSPKDEVAITELANHTQDIQTVKTIMKDISDRYKPIRKGDKIKSFTYFVPGIKDRLFVEQKQKEVKPKDERPTGKNDPYAGIGLSF